MTTAQDPPPRAPWGRFGRGTQWVLDHPRLAMGVTVIALVVAALYATQIRLDFSSTAFYGGDDPAAIELQRFQDRWGADDATLYVLAESTPTSLLATAPLRTLAELERALAEQPGVQEVVGLQTLIPSVGSDAASLATHFETADPRSAAALRAMLLGSTMVPRFLSRDGTRTIIAIRLAQSSDDVQRVTPVVDRLHTLVDHYDQRTGLTLQLAGVPAIRAGFYTLALGDQLRLGPLVGLGLAVLLWVSFRRRHGVLIPLVLTAVPVVGLVGLMAANAEPIGLLNQSYFTLLPVIAVADAVHLIAAMHEIMRRDEVDPHDERLRRHAIVEACDRIGSACLLTSVTTGLGFASLAFAQTPILRQFGLYAAGGIGLAYLALLTLGPLLLDKIRVRPPPASAGIHRLAHWSTRQLRPRWAIIAAIGLAVASTIAGQRVTIDNRLSELLPADHPVRLASARVDQYLGGTLSLEIELELEDHRSWPTQRQSMAELEAWLALQPETRTVLGPTTLDNLTPSLGLSTPAVERLRARVLDEPNTRARISIGVADIGGQAFAALADRVQARLTSWPGHAIVTGTSLLAYRGVNRIASELRTSLVGVILIVSLAIAVLLGDLRTALVALVPNVLPLAMAYAGLGLLGIELDPLAAVILCVALSIAVDDSLHLLARVHREHAEGRRGPDALTIAVAHCGHAAGVTSVALIGGLLMNLLSSFPPLQLLGGLGASTIALAWILDVIMLPALLRAAHRS